MQEYIKISILALIAVVLIVLTIIIARMAVSQNKLKAKLEGKFYFESQRIVWRIINTGNRNFAITEIGLKCGDCFSSYRPLLLKAEEMSGIPQLLLSGDIASYRKEFERFSFRQSEIDRLKILDPILEFYFKDAEGKIYTAKSEVCLVQYLTTFLR